LDPIYLHLVTFLAGLIVGNRFALWRDQRKEFNDSALPIRTWLLKQIEGGGGRRPDAIELDTFMSYLNPWQRERFRRAYEGELETHRKATYQTETGEVRLPEEATTLIKEYLKACLPYTTRR